MTDTGDGDGSVWTAARVLLLMADDTVLFGVPVPSGGTSVPGAPVKVETIGGSINPREASLGTCDGASTMLAATALRELREETRGVLRINDALFTAAYETALDHGSVSCTCLQVVVVG